MSLSTPYVLIIILVIIDLVILFKTRSYLIDNYLKKIDSRISNKKLDIFMSIFAKTHDRGVQYTKFIGPSYTLGLLLGRYKYDDYLKKMTFYYRLSLIVMVILVIILLYFYY